LITGASGYVGARILQDLRKNHDVTGTFCTNKFLHDMQKLDITDKKAVIKTISEEKPDLIIHAAAISSRRRCEQKSYEAITTNAHGTKNLVEAANTSKARVFYISSLAAIEPMTQYGKTKLMGEEYVKKTRIGYNILRLSMTFGYSPNTQNDRPFNRIVNTLREGKPTYYDNTWKFPPTFLRHVSETIQVLLGEKIENKTIAIVIPELKSMYEIASDILKPFGKIVRPNCRTKKWRKIESLPTPSGLELPRYSYEEMIQAITQEIKEKILT
jgi:dTDP-4-dehydrorhamnose reductase